MKLSRLYQEIIRLARERDPRKDRSKIKSYQDTAILYGDPDTEVNDIMVGIDMEVAELLLADKIRKEHGLDLVISHHPEGRGLAGLHEVMRLQVDILANAGVNRKVAEELLEERMAEVERRVIPGNLERSVDAARLLDMPFMCVHTPADNHVSYFLQELFKQKKPKTVQDIVDILLTIPEYKEAKESGYGPRIILGSGKRPVGKIVLEMTGGTEGSKDSFDKLYRAGVRTLVSMHLSEEHLRKVKDNNLNVVIAGHISSDTLGLNLLLDRLEKQAGRKFRVIGCSGFRRINR